MHTGELDNSAFLENYPTPCRAVSGSRRRPAMAATCAPILPAAPNWHRIHTAAARHQRRPDARAGAPRARRCGRLHPRRPTLDAAGLLPKPTPSAISKPRAKWRGSSKTAQALAETIRFLDGLSFSLDELQHRLSRMNCARAMPASRRRSKLSREGATLRYPARRAGQNRAKRSPRTRFRRDETISAYFLTVHDIVRFARATAAFSCQGRGSAANSVVCYCLGITEVDPNMHRSAVRALHLAPSATSRPTSTSISSTSGAKR